MTANKIKPYFRQSFPTITFINNTTQRQSMQNASKSKKENGAIKDKSAERPAQNPKSISTSNPSAGNSSAIGQYSFNDVEQSALSFWRKHDTYHKAKEYSKKGPSYYFLDGPPYTSGK